MSEPREWTPDEVRERLLGHFWCMVRYWAAEDRAPTALEKMQGLVHSILVALDGCAGELPMFYIAPSPHPDDKAFMIAEGENWYPDDCDDIGMLHEDWYNVGRKLGFVPPLEPR